METYFASFKKNAVYHIVPPYLSWFFVLQKKYCSRTWSI